MNKDELFRGIEAFNGMKPKDAIEEITDFFAWYMKEYDCDPDERVSDAIKRLQCFVEETEQLDGLSMYLDEEIRFRLKCEFGIEDPSQELVDYINLDKLDDCEGYIDGQYLSSLIKEALEEKGLI